MLSDMIAPVIPREQQEWAGLKAACKCSFDGYPYLGAVGMITRFPTFVLLPVVLTKVVRFVKYLVTFIFRTTICLVARLMKVVHMSPPIRWFAK